MASKDRETTPDIAPPANEHFRRLLENPHQFGLYSALRAIECAYPETPRVAESDHPAEEPVRVAQAPSMSFAPASISDAESTRMGFLRLWQQVVGLFGPNGPMPHHVTETAWQRQHNHDDPTITAFLNVFHHRMVSLFYRARANAEPTLHFDRPDQDRFQDYLASLLGLGVDAFRNRDEMPDRIKFHFVGRLAAQQKNREGLEVILATYLDVPVKIEEFAGQWIELPKDSRNAVGTSLGTTTL
ncbi:MAG: type VI secretion system baseplate subunit TssG, partial [Planctomycetota bacterium]